MKILKTLLCMMALVFCLTGCGGGKKEITVDVEKLASELQSGTVTSDTLAQTPADMLSSIYFVDAAQITKGAAYMSSGATACEVAVIECKEAKQTEDVKKLFETRVKNQSALFASYNAGEVAKLDKAVIKTAGKYAVLAVCDDTAKAEEILKNYGF